MNRLLLLVGILFAVPVYTKLWIMVIDVLCRTVLFISPRTYPISVTLNNIIQKSFAEEYAERKSEHESLTQMGINLMPLFVMDVVLPCQKLSLNIFEPRYRLMVRRVMEGNH